MAFSASVSSSPWWGFTFNCRRVFGIPHPLSDYGQNLLCETVSVLRNGSAKGIRYHWELEVDSDPPHFGVAFRAGAFVPV